MITSHIKIENNMLIDDIKEMVRTFSFAPMIRSNLSAPPNIMGSGQPSSSQAEPTALISNRLMSTYYLRIQELKNYEMTDLTEMIVGLFSDYITSYIKDDHSKVVSLSEEVPKSELYSDEINEVLAGLNYVQDLKLHLFEYIYYGGYSYSIHWDEKNREFKKKLLFNPSNLVASYSDDGLKSYLVQSKQSSIEEANPGNIIMIGNPTMELLDNISKDFKDQSWGFEDRKSDTIYRAKQYRACKPLYYSIIGKVKEYLLKDQLINILSIKDLIAPLVYSVGMDKNTDPATADNLVTNIENLINKYADVSVIIESNFDVNSLLDQINNNIKLVTDYNQNIANMSSLDLIKVNDRINELRNDQDNIRNGILQSCGIPESLFNGDATKWDAIKSSQRLSSKVGYYIEGLRSSIKVTACLIYNKLTGLEITPDQVNVNIFNSTEVEYNNIVNSAELISNVLQSITDIIDKAKSTVENYGDMIDSKKFLENIVDNIHRINPECDAWINEETIAKYVKAVADGTADDGFGGGFGGQDDFGDPNGGFGDGF